MHKAPAQLCFANLLVLITLEGNRVLFKPIKPSSVCDSKKSGFCVVRDEHVRVTELVFAESGSLFVICRPNIVCAQDCLDLRLNLYEVKLVVWQKYILSERKGCGEARKSVILSKI